MARVVWCLWFISSFSHLFSTAENEKIELNKNITTKILLRTKMDFFKTKKIKGLTF
jgi:hypothetical protein